MPFAATPDTLAGAAWTLAVVHRDEPGRTALTRREQREYDALPHAARRRDWLAGREAAKRAIAVRWAMSADRIELRSLPNAAPRPRVRTVTGAWSPLPDRLTIAHRDGFAFAAAFPSTASIGVDVERAGELSPWTLRYFLSEDERERHAGIDATLLWVLKEAAWKALALPPSTALSALELVFQAGTAELIAVRLGTCQLSARASVANIDASRPLIAALVVIAPEAA
jgi:4'-phosphopantetheinyl transferase EntD